MNYLIQLLTENLHNFAVYTKCLSYTDFDELMFSRITSKSLSHFAPIFYQQTTTSNYANANFHCSYSVYHLCQCKIIIVH